MTHVSHAGTFLLGDRLVHRMGYGTMQLAGPGVFGPVRDRAQACAVLQAAVEAGVDHIDTADFYGPHLTNRLIREALQPYAAHLTLATKVGVRRGDDASWHPAAAPGQLRQAVHDNLRNLGVEVLEVVNYRAWGTQHAPDESSLEEAFTTLAELQHQGLIRHLGLSNVSAVQVEQARRIAPVVCVQNHYNLVHRRDDGLIDTLASLDIAYVPFFPLGGFTPLQSDVLARVAARMGVSPSSVALAALLQRSPNILLIPGTSSLAHLQENLRAAALVIAPDDLAELQALAPSAHGEKA